MFKGYLVLNRFQEVFEVKNILKWGVERTFDPLENRRIVFFNYLLLFCFVLTLGLAAITAYFGFNPQTLICLSATTVISSLLFLNYRGKVSISRILFLLLSNVLIVLGTLINVRNGFFVETENMLFGVMAISMFLIDGNRKHFAYWLTFTVFLLLKINSLTAEGVSDGFYLSLALINNIVVGLVVYAFLAAFSMILVKALDRNYKNERRLYSMIDNVPVFLALVDKDGKYILANEKYVNNFQMDKRGLTGKFRSDVLPTKVLENLKENFTRAQNGESVSFLQQTELPNGIVISANGKYEPVFDDKGEVESITICVDDVTPLIKAQEELKIANETKDKLFSIVAHDIRSPLNMFHTFLDMSEQADMSKEDFFEYQQTLKQRLSSLTGTIDELLEWSRMQLGGINAYPAMVNVSKVVNENIDLFDSIIKKKNIDFKVTSPSHHKAWIDENHFKVVLRNLIHNALKYTNGGGSVHVESDQSDDITIVRIMDTGVGMDAKTIDSIIKKEIQKSQAGTDREIGTGLGLSLSLGLLEKNNCEIEVTSEKNKGTAFEIKIPNVELS